MGNQNLVRICEPAEVCREHILRIFKEYEVTLNYKLEYGDDSKEFYEMLELYNKHEHTSFYLGYSF